MGIFYLNYQYDKYYFIFNYELFNFIIHIFKLLNKFLITNLLFFLKVRKMKVKITL